MGPQRELNSFKNSLCELIHFEIFTFFSLWTNKKEKKKKIYIYICIYISIRSEEVVLFLVLLIHINTHNRMEINL